MSINFKIILLPIFSQFFLLLLNIAVIRILIKRKVSFSPLLVTIKCALLGNIPVLLTAWSLLMMEKLDVPEIRNGILYILITYNALAYSYSHIFNMSETARRIRILYELNLEGRFHYNKLSDKYGIKNMLDVRLERLISLKQVSRSNDRFMLSSLLLYRIGVVVLSWGFFLKYNIHLKQKITRGFFYPG